HRQRLVHQKNIGISVNGNGKRQAHHHPGRIGTQRLADKASEFSEFNDVIPATTEFFLRHSQQQPVGADIGKSAHGKVEAGTQLQQTGDATTGVDSAAIRKYSTVKNFEQGGFAGAVAANKAQGFTVGHLKGNILQRLMAGVKRSAQDNFLEA